MCVALFSERLAQIMKEKKITQYRLWKLTGISQPAISGILSGKKSPKGETLQKLCDALGVSMAEFDDNSIKDNAIDIKRKNVLEQLDHMDLNEEQQAALAYIKKMPLDKQQQSFLEIYKKFKSLSVSDQEAVSKIIDSLASSHK